jgi:uncharacterized SAM-binding protein YcdF (DUF218 family)
MSYLQPVFPALLFLAFVALFRIWRRSTPHDRPWLLTFSLVGLLLFSLNPMVWLFSRPLETWYDQNPAPNADADAIVVLAGAVALPLPDRPYPMIGPDTYVRLHHAAWLFKHWAARPILASGGGEDGESYSQTMRHVLEAEGIPPDKIWVEDRSQSTYENAVYSARILREKGISRIALVTDARSMLRAEACFREQGLTVVPAPFRFYNLDLTLEDFLPTWRAIESNGETAHELVGLLWYWLSRRI